MFQLYGILLMCLLLRMLIDGMCRKSIKRIHGSWVWLTISVRLLRLKKRMMWRPISKRYASPFLSVYSLEKCINWLMWRRLCFLNLYFCFLLYRLRVKFWKYYEIKTPFHIVLSIFGHISVPSHYFSNNWSYNWISALPVVLRHIRGNDCCVTMCLTYQ